MKVDTSLQADLGGVAEAARRYRDLGLDGVFTFEGPHDVFVPLTLAAEVPDLDLYSNIAVAFPRSPMHLAHVAYDLQLLTQGRFMLGLGSQVRAQIERRYGATWSRPAARMRELVLAIKAIFAAWHDRTKLDFRGEFYTHTLMTPTFDPGPHPYGPPPVLVGALGPRMARTAAEVADGILVMPFNSERHMHARTMPVIEDGLAAAGRDRGSFTVVCEVIVCAGRTDEEMATAEAGVRNLLSFYGSTPSYKPVLDEEGWGDLQPDLNLLSKQGRWGEMAGLVDDTMLRTLAVRGTPAECAQQVVARFGGVADRVAFYTPYRAPLDLVGEVATALRRHG